MIKTAFLDLDGTLLPMDVEAFTRTYFGLLGKHIAQYDAKDVIKGVQSGVVAMVKNDGSISNEQAFWQVFCQKMGDDAIKTKPFFDEFYRTKFLQVKSTCGFNAQANAFVKQLKARGLKVVLASNPIFPLVAQQARMTWAGVDLDDFCHITCYENSFSCKPNPLYYTQLLEQFGLVADECIMIGNDVEEDMVATTVGMHGFLLTEHLINKHNKDIALFPRGDYQGALAYVDGINK